MCRITLDLHFLALQKNQPSTANRRNAPIPCSPPLAPSLHNNQKAWRKRTPTPYGYSTTPSRTPAPRYDTPPLTWSSTYTATPHTSPDLEFADVLTGIISWETRALICQSHQPPVRASTASTNPFPKSYQT